MDERVLVEVYVPAAGKYLEILLPVQAQLRSLHIYVAQLLEQTWGLKENSPCGLLLVSGAAGHPAGFSINSTGSRHPQRGTHRSFIAG